MHLLAILTAHVGHGDVASYARLIMGVVVWLVSPVLLAAVETVLNKNKKRDNITRNEIYPVEGRHPVDIVDEIKNTKVNEEKTAFYRHRQQ